MKTKILILTFAFVAAQASAQQNVFTIGAEGGISVTSLNYDNKTINDIYESRTGYAAGLSLQYNFPKVFSLRSGAMFELKGDFSKITFTDVNGNVIGVGEVKKNLGYLTIPLYLRATFGNKINFFIQGGPYWSSLLSARLDIDPLPASINYNSDIKYQFESSEFGLSGGIGVSSVFNNLIVISFEVRNNSGITNISKDTYQVHTRSLLFLAGIGFALGKRAEEVK